MAASEKVLLKLEPEELEAIDRVRGGTPRTVWIKDLCRAAVVAREQFGRACGLRVVAQEPGDGR